VSGSTSESSDRPLLAALVVLLLVSSSVSDSADIPGVGLATSVAFLDDEADAETGAGMSSAERLFPGAHNTLRRLSNAQ